MIFAIQTCSPMLVRDQIPEEASDLSGAVEVIYAPCTEDAILFWNRVPVRISYRYDLSVLLDDLVPLIGQVVGDDEGSEETRWASNTFSAVWQMGWDYDQIRISSYWRAVAGSYEELLNSRSTVEVPRMDFLGEWRPLLDRVRIDVKTSKIRCEDILLLNRLNDLVPRLPERSSFYGNN